MTAQNEPDPQADPQADPVKKRIAFFCIPAHGHTNPMLPVAAELVRRGHTVRFYSFGGTGGLPDFSEKIRKTGAEFVPCDACMPAVSAAEIAGLKRVSITEMTVQAIRVTLAMDAFLDAEFKSFRPDVVYTDSACFWGKLNAWKHHVPMVVSTSTFAFNQLSSTYMKHPPAEIADMVFGLPRIGKALKSMEPYGYKVKNPLTLVQSDNKTDSVVYTSRRFQPFAESFSGHYAFVGPSVFSDAVPDKKKARPLVYISLGTVINDRPDFYGKCIEALKDMDVDVLISCGMALDREKLGVLPENVRVEPYVDQLDVLSRADVFLTHCGMNSVSESLYMATPMVLYPQTGEQYAVAKRTAELGAGILLVKSLGEIAGPSTKPDTLKGIRAAVQNVLENASYRDAAAECGRDFRACSGVAGAADFIENAPHDPPAGRDILKEVKRESVEFQILCWLNLAAVMLLGFMISGRWNPVCCYLLPLPILVLAVIFYIAGKGIQLDRYMKLVRSDPKEYRREARIRFLFWGVLLPLFILLSPFLFSFGDPVCVHTYLNTRTFEYESYVRVGPLVFQQDSASFFQGDLEPYRNALRQDRLPEYWIRTGMHAYTITFNDYSPYIRGGKYPVKVRYFLWEHIQEMIDPDYKETEEEFSDRFTDFILSLNEDERYKGALLPADTDLRARSGKSL